MPLAKKISPSVLPEELQNQIVNNFKKDDEPVERTSYQSSQTIKTSLTTQMPTTAVQQQVAPPVEPSTTSTSIVKSKYSDSVNLRLTSGKRNEFKMFFTECEISMNQGFEMAVDYIMRESRAGRIHVSKSGITKNGE